jgi:ABC-type glycerol-3-phosphate transport system substrate-binding protein
MAVLPKSRLIILGVSGAVIILGALVFLGIIPGLQTPGEGKPVPLTVWGPIDSEDTVTRAAQGLNYQIAYERIDPAKYESTLVNALASGEGPDVFMVHSSWLPKHFAKLLPAPAAAITGAAFDSLYPTVATQDFAPDGIVYALPLYIDTLTLFYNKDLFDSAGIAVPPKTWVDFETLVPKLRGLDATG